MVAPRTPPRFVPTLTDVVDSPVQLPQAALPQMPLPRAPQPPVVAHEVTAVASPSAFSPDLEAAIAEHVHAMLQERLSQTLHFALQDLRPLVHEAVAEALAKRPVV